MGGSVRPGRGDEAGFMGYTAMLQSDGPEGWWQSTDPPAGIKWAMLVDRYEGRSSWRYGAYSFKWNKARLAGRMTVAQDVAVGNMDVRGAVRMDSPVTLEHVLWPLYRAMQRRLGVKMRAAFAAATGYRFDPQMRADPGLHIARPRRLIGHVHGELDLTDLDELIIHWSRDRWEVGRRGEQRISLPDFEQAMRVQQDFLRFRHEHGLSYRVVLKKYVRDPSRPFARQETDYPESYK